MPLALLRVVLYARQILSANSDCSSRVLNMTLGHSASNVANEWEHPGGILDADAPMFYLITSACLSDAKEPIHDLFFFVPSPECLFCRKRQTLITM